MLDQTFIHVPGIGRRTERDLWEAGVTSWDYFDGILRRPVSISAGLRRRLEAYIPQSLEAVQRKDAGFFSRLSRLGEAWRLFPEFANQCVFLDIETTGLSTVFDTVTMVGLFDGSRYEAFIAGQNLQDLPDRLRKYSVVVTFNGAGFDLRFLKLAFQDLELPPIHIDLRWITRRLGYRGGLKSIEKEFGILRDRSVEEIDGREATILWSRHLRGDRAALRQLVTYNSEDVVHLKAIMEISYDQLAAQVQGALSERMTMFSRVAAIPKAPKLANRAFQTPSRTLVSQLLAGC
jgi:uncharacterized protein YprB with RNaseH-like and TPR domain